MKKYYLIATILLSLIFIPTSKTNAEESKEEGLKPVYALWNKNYSYRYLTLSESEKNNLILDSKWKNEGILWYAYENQVEGVVPVFKLKNEKYFYYYYTTSLNEKDALIKDKKWTYKNIAFYAYNDSNENNIPIYSLRNTKTNRYHYTSNIGERNCYLSNLTDWIDKGTAFWVPKEKAQTSEDEFNCINSFGPEISVGLWKTTSSDAKENSFKIKADKDYLIKDKNGNIIKEVSANSTTKVKYSGDKKLLVYGSVTDTNLEKEVFFEAKNANEKNSIIFDVSRPSSDYDRYRGKIKIRYAETSKEIWMINILPMEHYVWGMGETTGTGAFEHTKVMTAIFRTYGYWYLEYATKYLPYGFQIKSDSGNQIYRGYDWEIKYPNIKKAALETGGIIAMYKNEIALTPYSSWSDGKTRSFKERWGSSEYPWCKSVKDPYGKHPSKSTKQLEKEGNHMVGLIGYGSVKLADKYKWDYKKIMNYYYSGIELKKKY